VLKLDLKNCQLTSSKFSREPDVWRKKQAHFCCELAKQSIADNQVDDFESRIRQALNYNPQCVRAILLSAKYTNLETTNQTNMLNSLQRTVSHSPLFISETLYYFNSCLNAKEKLEYYLKLYAQVPSVALFLAVIKVYFELADLKSCRHFVLLNIAFLPELKVERLLIELAIKSERRLEESILEVVNYIQSKQCYRCQHCGVEHEKMQWQCPSCKSWETIVQTV